MEGGEEGESEFLFRRPIILSADIITKMDRRDKGKKKKIINLNIFFEIQTSISRRSKARSEARWNTRRKEEEVGREGRAMEL